MPITQTITALPTPPNPATDDNTTFPAKASAFTVAQAAMGPELNTFATQANTLETNVTALEAAALVSKNAAAASATAAAASQTAAGTSQTASAASQTAAAASAAAALASLNDFKGRWYGPLAANPVVDPLGAAIGEGDAYWNMVSKLTMVYNGATWQSTTDISMANLAATTGSTLIGHDDLLGLTLDRVIDRLPSRHGRASAADLPRFMNTVRAYRHDLQAQIPIVGVGSSVGNGAALADPATDAPVAYFRTQLEAIFDPGNLYNIVVSNQSVNGSVVTDFATAWAAVLALGYTTPGIVVFAYGMNDQQPAAYNSGQTYPGFITKLREAVRTVRDAGWEAVILTTPHASVVRYPSLLSLSAALAQTYPTAIAAPVSDAALQPSAATGAITTDILGDGVTITVSHRALRINQAMRNIAREFSCPLVDVELYWFEALQKYKLLGGTMAAAEGYLYDGAENVHPNLLGHQLSYQRAIKDFLQGFARQTSQASFEARLNGRIGVNSELPAAVLEVKPAYGDTSPTLNVYGAVGQADGAGVRATGLVFEVEETTGDLVAYCCTTNNSTATPLEAWRVHAGIDSTGTVIAHIVETRKLNGMTFKDHIENGFNVGAGVRSPTINLPANSSGRLNIDAYQSGIGTQRTEAIWATTGAAATITVLGNVQTGAVFTGPTATGLRPDINVASAGTTLVWEIEYRT